MESQGGGTAGWPLDLSNIPSSEAEVLNTLFLLFDKAELVLALRYTVVAALTVLVYDVLLTFAEEVEHFWRGRRSWMNGLFVINRYFPICYEVFNTVARLLPPPNDQLLLCVTTPQGFFPWLPDFAHKSHACAGRFWCAGLQTWAPAIQIFAVHATVAARLNAVYGNKRHVQILLGTMLALTSLGYCSFLAFNTVKMTVTSLPLPTVAPGFRICWVDNIQTVAWVLFPVIFFEIVLFAALLHKVLGQLKKDYGSYGFGWHDKRICLGCQNNSGICSFRRAQRTLLHIILRDHVYSFVMVIVMFSAEAVMWTRLDRPESELLSAPTIAIISILSSRMLLNIREEGQRLAEPSMGTMTGAADAMLGGTTVGLLATQEEEKVTTAQLEAGMPMTAPQSSRNNVVHAGPPGSEDYASQFRDIPLAPPTASSFAGSSSSTVNGHHHPDNAPNSWHLRRLSRRQFTSTQAGQQSSRFDDVDETVVGHGMARKASTQSNLKGKQRLEQQQEEQLPFQHVLAISRQASPPRGERTVPAYSVVTHNEQQLQPTDGSNRWLRPRASSATTVSSRTGPRPRTPSNASSDASMPWHIPEFVSYEDQRRSPNSLT